MEHNEIQRIDYLLGGKGLLNEEAVSPDIKKEFQRWVKEIYANLKKDMPDIADNERKARNAISQVIMAIAPSNSTHNQMKKYFPAKYDVTLVTNGDKNLYDSEWWKMTDSQQDTIIKKGMSL
jgi:NCAIR mutase (PurE)-related protein